jgi:hypothetical protein
MILSILKVNLIFAIQPRVVKLVYTRDLKSLDFGHTGSSPVSGTTNKEIFMRKMKEQSNSYYQSEDGWKMELEEKFVEGILQGTFWVLRNSAGKFIDSDGFRHALAERNNLRLD